jgi:hypothetical protein
MSWVSCSKVSSNSRQLLPSLPSWASKPAPVDPEPESEAETEDDDVPPPFPLPESAQRSSAPALAPSLALAPPSPERSRSASPPTELNIAILPDPIPLGDMAPPPSTTVRPAFGIKPGGGMEAPATPSSAAGSGLGVPPAAALTPAPAPAKKKRGKVALAPGCSALDWARLAKSGADLRGTGSPAPMRVTMDELKKVRRVESRRPT